VNEVCLAHERSRTQHRAGSRTPGGIYAPRVGTGCFVSPTRSIESAIERVKLAESLGYETVYVTHIAGWESLTVLTAYAGATSTIRVGTGVVPIYTRTPATMAQTAATIDAISGGRLTLGLGVSHRPVVEGWHGQSIDHPAAEMREYAGIVRAILRGEDPPTGEKWRTGFHLFGLDLRPELPIYVAALSPTMLRLAGEVADGVILWLCCPDYIRDVVIPEVTKGRERAGKTLEGFDVVPAVPAAVVSDPAEPYAAMRKDLLPFYRAMLERSGFGAEIEAFDAAAGDVEQMQAAISERFLNELTAVGDDTAVRTGIDRYRQAGATSPCVGPIPKTDFEATLRAGVA
jgi:alkanesulfonate monooxygenase SsuD/methylene tetrahydromethanopterin reductase-like flavin-dependent oxidoreductase (luciferase family)